MCYSGSITRVWRKDSKGLYVGSVKSHSNSRITLLSNGSLEIRDITPEDTGAYKCMVARSKDSQEVEHSLNIKGKIFQEFQIYFYNF